MVALPGQLFYSTQILACPWLWLAAACTTAKRNRWAKAIGASELRLHVVGPTPRSAAVERFTAAVGTATSAHELSSGPLRARICPPAAYAPCRQEDLPPAGVRCRHEPDRAVGRTEHFQSSA